MANIDEYQAKAAYEALCELREKCGSAAVLKAIAEQFVKSSSQGTRLFFHMMLAENDNLLDIAREFDADDVAGAYDEICGSSERRIVYVVTEDRHWNFEHFHNVYVYNNMESADKKREAIIDQAFADLSELYDDHDIVFDKYAVYLDGGAAQYGVFCDIHVDIVND